MRKEATLLPDFAIPVFISLFNDMLNLQNDYLTDRNHLYPVTLDCRRLNLSLSLSLFSSLSIVGASSLEGPSSL